MKYVFSLLILLHGLIHFLDIPKVFLEEETSKTY